MARSIAKSRLEALLSMATGAAAEVPAGLAGLYGAATGGSGEAVRMIDKVRDKLTYQPRDPRGQQEIARALGPIMQKIEAGKSYLGDGAFNKTGSPALAAAAYTAPDAILSLLGARPAIAAGRSASKGIGALVERSARLPSPAIGSPASQIGAIRAYHGSPHDFDRFSMDHIGTGEGAQAYGHGLYFAGKPEVAQGYRAALTPDAFPDGDPRNGIAKILAAKGDDVGLPLIQKAYGGQLGDSLSDAIEQARAANAKNGRLYEVELAPDDADLLDWDAPLSEQPEKIQQAYQQFLQTDLAKQADESLGGILAGRQGQYADPRGQDFYGAVFEAMPGMGVPARAGVTEQLRRLGIPGIRYLDGGSRAAGDGSRNYVMFDDSLIKILGKK